MTNVLRAPLGASLTLWVVLLVAGACRSHADTRSIASIMARRVSLRADGMPLRAALSRLFEQAGANYVLEQAGGASVTCCLRNVPLRAALAAVLKANRTAFTIRGGVFVVVREEVSSFGAGQWSPPGRPVAIALHYTTPSSVIRYLRSLPGLSADDGVTISAHDAQGYLVVATQTNDQLRELKEALRLID